MGETLKCNHSNERYWAFLFNMLCKCKAVLTLERQWIKSYKVSPFKWQHLITALGAQQRTQTNFAAGVPVYWDVWNRERRKNSRLLCFCRAVCLSAGLGSFFLAPSWIHREQALRKAFLKCMSLVSLLEVNNRCIILLSISLLCLKESLLLPVFFKACWNDATTFLPFSEFQSIASE